ncbi:MAG: NAD-dependent epimerase/dehydratase family protein [Sphingomonadales bacterium]|nr:NAD-dependent epimerase/dehydratase family protein [Sphingomonadales bacterium]
MTASPHVVGVIGANGFIGNRIVEMLHLGGVHDVRPIVRQASGLALASRFALAGRIADAFDEAAIEAALQGCDIVVHALAGDHRAIVGTVGTVYRAAERAGCKRLVYLSSAMVHGQSPPPGCDDATPLSHKQPIHYNLSKIKAEERLFALRRKRRLEAVALRPGIVFGPRSQWIGGLADSLLTGEAYLIDGGEGLCNAIYVDNLVEGIVRAFDAPAADGEAFLLGDAETPRWEEVYRRVAGAVGVDMASVPSLGFTAPMPGLMDRVDEWRQSAPVRAALDALPKSLSRGLGAFWAASGALPPPPPKGPNPTLEMALLQRAQHVPGWERAHRLLGYAPVVQADEAWARTLAWLAFAGYPTGARDG